MPGTMPLSESLSMSDLAATLTKYEQLQFERVTEIAMDPAKQRNLMTMINQEGQLGTLSVCSAGSSNAGTKVLTATVYISGVAKEIDLYRLPAAAS